MDDWANDLGALWDICWARLREAVEDGASPMHRPVLATVGIGGAAEARVLVLRQASKTDTTLGLNTDTASTKVSELSTNPLATLLFWHPDDALQLRARVRVDIDSHMDALWRELSDRARTNYGGTPPTGAPIPAPDAYDKVPDPARLSQLICHLQSLDVVYLGPQHRRARYDRSGDFAGRWLAP